MRKDNIQNICYNILLIDFFYICLIDNIYYKELYLTKNIINDVFISCCM